MSGEQVREWRDVVGWGGKYVGLYQVSNDGCVRRVKGGMGAKVGRILKQHLDRAGYLVVRLSVDGMSNTRRVHQLVAQAFCPNPDAKYAVDHIDRNKVNNHVSNLRYATRAENAINTAGRTNTGIKHISKSRSNGYPAFFVSIRRGRKNVVRKYFPIKDRDEDDVLAEAVAYRNEKYTELAIQADDREADGAADRDGDARTDGCALGGTELASGHLSDGTSQPATFLTDGSFCAHLQPILEYIYDNVTQP